MSLAGGAQTENKAQRAARQVGLIRVRHNRGIEQRGGFERVLMRKMGAEQQLPLFGDRLAGGQIGANLLEAPTEELGDFEVTFGELGLHLVQQAVDFTFGQGHDVRANPGRTLLAGMERPDQDASAVRMQDELKALLGREVDLVSRRGVESSRNPIRREAILSSAEYNKAA